MGQPGDQAPDRRLGDFEVVRELGRGGMGVVYEARQVSLNRKVALKVLSGGLGLTPKAVHRFRREAEAAARLHHTNIVPVYATGEQDGTHYYAMELIEGPSLDQVLRQMRQRPARGEPTQPGPGAAGTTAADLTRTDPYYESPYSPPAAADLSSSSLGSGGGYYDTVARLVAEVADALEYAHSHGVIHRDVKPSNLLLSPEGRLSVNDFGLARVLEQPGVTLTGEFVGTPAYMSPEQITGGRVPIDHRTDVYSLGATLYELLTLQAPFTGSRRDQVLAQILHKDPRSPRKLNPRVPVDLETICLKAMEKDPDRRYQTARAMAEDLRRYLNRFAIAARRAGPVARIIKWVRRHPGVTAALACALVAVGAASFFAYQSYALREQQLAERRQAALEKALLAAMSNDFDDAEKAIEEAERYEASPGQVRFLNGLVAYYRGHEADAIKQLEVAVKLLPPAESAAARGLLAVAYSYAGRGGDTARMVRELDGISPVTLEDYLFKGAAVGQMDPEAGVKLIDEAVRRRPSSGIARIFRADLQCSLAQVSSDPAAADRAIADVLQARAKLPEPNPVALWISCWVHQVSAGVYQSLGLQEKFKAALDQAGKDAVGLQAFPDLPSAVSTRYSYYWYYGQKDQTLDEMRRLVRKTELPIIAFSLATALYWRGARADLEEAAALLDGQRGNPGSDYVRCFVLAELSGPEAALEAYRQAAQADLEGQHRLRLRALLFMLGRIDQVREESRRDRKEQLPFPVRQQVFFHKVLDYLAGDLAEVALVETAATSRFKWDDCLAHYFIGMARLAEGDRAGARASFRQAVETRNLGELHYDLSMVLLDRLERDATWPPWIPAKK
jgi:serine/threonine protein kinase